MISLYFYKGNRVKGYPKVVLKKLRGKHATALKRRTTVGLQQFHRSTSTPIDMFKTPTASIQVLELGDELILTSRAIAPRSKSVPPKEIRTPAEPSCRTSVSARVTPPQQAPPSTSSASAKNSVIISKPAHVETMPNKSNLREQTPTRPGPSSRTRTEPHTKSKKVICIAKRVRAPTPHRDISPTPVIDLCDSDDEDDPNSSPPKKSKTTTPVPVVVEPVIPEAPPLPTAMEGPSSMEVNVDDTGKDTGTALAVNQDDNENEIVMEISSQQVPEPSEASTSHASVTQIPETSEHPSTSFYCNPPRASSQCSPPGTSANVNPGTIPQQIYTQPNADTFNPTNPFPYYSSESQPQFEQPQNFHHYDYDITDAPPEATGTFTQHEPHSQSMDFEFPTPAPGTGIGQFLSFFTYKDVVFFVSV